MTEPQTHVLYGKPLLAFIILLMATGCGSSIPSSASRTVKLQPAERTYSDNVFRIHFLYPADSTVNVTDGAEAAPAVRVIKVTPEGEQKPQTRIYIYRNPEHLTSEAFVRTNCTIWLGTPCSGFFLFEKSTLAGLPAVRFGSERTDGRWVLAARDDVAVEVTPPDSPVTENLQLAQ